MDLGLRDKSILVVGGTRGMGLATAQRLHAEGARVGIVGRDPERTAKVAAEIAPEVVAIAADVRAEASGEQIVAAAAESLGGLNGLAVLTGVAGHEPFDVPDGVWDSAYRDVVMGTVRVVRAAVSVMAERGGGSIVVTSAYSIRAPHGNRMPYGMFKATLPVLAKGIAKSYGDRGIRANCVCPGAIETEALHEMRGVYAREKSVPYDEALERVMVEDWNMKVGLGRPGRPSEVGALIAFLLSDVAGYLTGATINIDGGTDF